MIELSSEIDRYETVKNATHFFTKEFPRIVRMAGHSIGQLRAMTLSDMPKAQQMSNQAEKAIVRRLAAERIVQQTLAAIAACDPTEAEILRLRYMTPNVRFDYQVYGDIGYSERSYRYYKNSALLAFAEAFQGESLIVFRD